MKSIEISALVASWYQREREKNSQQLRS